MSFLLKYFWDSSSYDQRGNIPEFENSEFRITPIKCATKVWLLLHIYAEMLHMIYLKSQTWTYTINRACSNSSRMKSGVSTLFRTFKVKFKNRTHPSHSDRSHTRRRQFAQLRGVKCFFVWRKIVKPRALLATRAQASVMSEASSSQNIPDVKINPISDLLGDDELLTLKRCQWLRHLLQRRAEVGISL